jgi:hypothetical protein
MELSDYDLLGISSKATFRLVKNAYHELSRIYHPDSKQIIIGMTKKDREIAFKRIKTAYENIKAKMNVVEVDLPDSEIEYEVEYVIKKDKINKIDTNDKNFNEKFNKEFEKINTFENVDNPYSIHYKVPEKSKRNLQDSQIILKESSSCKSSNTYEFGINYIEEHSTDKYYDFKKLESNDSNLENTKEIKETIDTDLDKKLEELINIRNQSIEITETDLEFINRQNRVKKDIEDSKVEVEHNRRITLLN